MFINPDLSGQLARDRQRELLARAEQQRLARQLHAASKTSFPAAASGHRVCGWVGRAAAMLRRPARIPARSAITRPVS
jgi:hypothetical protein